MPPQNSNNQYEFMMQPQKQPIGTAMLQSPKQRKIIFAIFALLVILVLVVLWNVISSIGKNNQEDLVEMTAYQTEIYRVAELGLDSSNDVDVRARVSTLKTFTVSDQAATLSYLAQNGIEVEKQQLEAKEDPAIDAALVSAFQVNRYDEELIEQLDTLILDYGKIITASLSEELGPNERELLENIESNIVLYYTEI